MYLNLINYLSSFLMLLLGIIGFRSSNNFKARAYFLAISIFIATWSLSFGFTFHFAALENQLAATYAIRTAWSTGIVVLISIFGFFLNFPQKNQKTSWLEIISIFYGTILFLITIFTPWIAEGLIIANKSYQGDVLGQYYPLYLATLILYLFGSILIGLRNQKKTSNLERNKIRIALFGFVTGIGMAILNNAILPFFNIFILQNESLLLSWIVLGSFFYALEKYRFFHLNFFLINQVRRIMILTLFIGSITIIELVIEILFPNSDALSKTIFASIPSLYLAKFAHERLPKFANQDFRKFSQEIKKLSNKILHINHFESLMNLLEQTFKVNLNIEEVKLVIFRKDTEVTNITNLTDQDFEKIIENQQIKFLNIQEIQYGKINKNDQQKIISFLEKNKFQNALFCYFGQKLSGALFISNKQKSLNFSQEEIDLLLEFRENLETTFVNILIKSNLKDENDLLKKTIDQKTSQITTQFNEIKNLLRQQSDFIAVTAHEFRTPLSIAIFQLEDTLDSHSIDPNLLEDMKVLENSLSNLRNLTQKLFDIQQFDLNKNQPILEKIQIGEWFKNILKEFQPLAKEKGFEFKFSTQLEKNKFLVQIDPTQFKQVIHNILSNALKFVKNQNPMIEVSLEKINQDVEIRIADNGQGISDENKLRIFEKFQSQKYTRDTGIGLGLYLCKKIIEAHNGSIYVQDNKEGGAIFVIRIPILKQ